MLSMGYLLEEAKTLNPMFFVGGTALRFSTICRGSRRIWTSIPLDLGKMILKNSAKI